MKLLHRITALAVFGYALVLYLATVAPSTSLWDTGEFIASAHGLQVMHPPGSPFYMLLGRLFSMFAPAGFIAVAVNLVSVLAAALTVMLAYLIIVQLVQAWDSRPPAERSAWDEGIAAAAGLAGALTLSGTDSFWFNAVEAEVYALSTFFIAMVVWLMLRWSARVREERTGGGSLFGLPGNRYLVLIAYLFGLSVGIHLMSVLTVFFVALILFFTLFDRAEWSRRERLLRLAGAGVVALVAFACIYPGLILGLPDLAGSSDTPVLVLLGIAALLAGGLFYTHRKRRSLAHLVLLSTAALLIGYSTYLLIPIRSTANPPIDLNNPESAEALVPYLKREQYGRTPLLKGPTYDDRTGRIDRSTSVLFPRRHSPNPRHLALYGGYDSDLDYFLRYQLGHMYGRYFLWNFVGRAHNDQHAGWTAGFSDPAQAGHAYTTPSEAASRNTYFALPLLLGLFGLAYHFKRDWRRALALFSLFLVTGVGLVVYLNEIPVTPRERDYIYVGSYFSFCLWIGIGAAATLNAASHLARSFCEGLGAAIKTPLLFKEGWPKAGVVSAAAALLLLAVPLRVLQQNYDDHDRSGNYLARDYAYNLLMSLEENAILFTGGDNDTYPLWYLQAVEGVRRDVRVVCLPLLITGWYALQLKHQWAYEAPPLPISLSDEQIEAMQFMAWQPQEVSLPVDKQQLLDAFEVPIPPDYLDELESPMSWILEGRPYNAETNVLYPSDLVILNVLMENARQGWPRPIYFASTSGPDDHLGLHPYFQREGLALRVVPVRHAEPQGRVAPEIMMDRLADFRFTNLNDPDVYYPDDGNIMWYHYRLAYTETADTLIEEGRPEAAQRVMDTLMDAVPPDTIPLNPVQALSMARTSLTLGDVSRSTDLMRDAEVRALKLLQAADTSAALQQAVGLARAVQVTYVQARAFDEAAAMSARLAALLGDPTLKQPPAYFERLYPQVAPPPSAARGRGN